MVEGATPQAQYRYDPGTTLTEVVRWADLTLAEGWILDAIGNPARLYPIVSTSGIAPCSKISFPKRKYHQ